MKAFCSSCKLSRVGRDASVILLFSSQSVRSDCCNVVDILAFVQVALETLALGDVPRDNWYSAWLLRPVFQIPKELNDLQLADRDAGSLVS